MVLRPVLIEPDLVDRLDRVDFVLRAERVDGVRPDRVEDVVCGGSCAACPHTLQYPSSMAPLHPDWTHATFALALAVAGEPFPGSPARPHMLQ